MHRCFDDAAAGPWDRALNRLERHFARQFSRHEAAVAAGRHGHGFGRGRGHGRFEAGFGEGGFGFGARFRTGRKLASGDLQLVILALLADAPRHGYEIIKALEERSAGFYAPSPGMVYPALTYLNEIGHATVEADGARKLYSITDEGRAYLAAHRETADAMLAEIARIGAKMAKVRRMFTGEGAEGGAEAGDEEAEGLSAELHRIGRRLKAALRGLRHAPAPEQRRVAAILRRAIAEIEGRDAGGDEERG